MAPDDFPLWVGNVEAGSVHDLTAAREHMLSALCLAASRLDLPTLADSGYDGAGIGVSSPVKQPADGRALQPRLRRPADRTLAALRHITTSPRKIGDVVKGALVVTHFVHGRLT